MSATPAEGGRIRHSVRLCVMRAAPSGLITRGSPRAPDAGEAVLRGQRQGMRSPLLLHLSGASRRAEGHRSPLPLGTPWRLRRAGGASFRTPPPSPPPARAPRASKERAGPLLDLSRSRPPQLRRSSPWTVEVTTNMRLTPSLVSSADTCWRVPALDTRLAKSEEANISEHRKHQKDDCDGN